MKIEALPLSEMRTHRSEKWRGFPPDVLPLFVAEMDFPVAKPIKDLLIEMISHSDMGYLSSIPELGEAFAGFAKRRWNWELNPKYVRLCTDVGVGMVEVLRVTTNPGDKVMINSPIYHNFYNWINETKVELVDVPFIQNGADWELDFEGIEQQYASGVKVHALCSPHNPLGKVFSRVDLIKLAKLAKQYQVTIISDEIHAPLTFPGYEFHPFLSVCPEAAEVGICVTSASKAFNVAGLKSALIVAQSEQRHQLLGKMPVSVHFRSSILGAFAAVIAFNECEDWLDGAISTIESNAHFLKTLLDTQLPAAKYQIPQCSYLAWVDVSELNLGDDPAAVFLEKGRVAFNSGKIYGKSASQFIRINLATSESVLSEAVNRMVKSL
ncbi:MAG: MalY/PatB family protein [Candidatus Nanopelagicaceae bacterium]